MLKPAELHLSQEWDKTFPQSDRVDHRKVTFLNRYGLPLAAALSTPKAPKAGCLLWLSAAPLGR